MRPITKCEFMKKQTIIDVKASYEGKAKESLNRKYTVYDDDYWLIFKFEIPFYLIGLIINLSIGLVAMFQLF